MQNTQGFPASLEQNTKSLKLVPVEEALDHTPVNRAVQICLKEEICFSLNLERLALSAKEWLPDFKLPDRGSR